MSLYTPKIGDAIRTVSGQYGKLTRVDHDQRNATVERFPGSTYEAHFDSLVYLHRDNVGYAIVHSFKGLKLVPADTSWGASYLRRYNLNNNRNHGQAQRTD